MAILSDQLGTGARGLNPRRLTTWIARPRVHGLPLVAVVLLLHLSGALAPLDRAAWRGRHALDPTVDRAAVPLVLAVDDATVATLGPPPWDPATWRHVSAALRRQGLAEVVVADPWPLLLRPTGDAGLPADVALLVPDLTWRGALFPEPPAPMEPLRAAVSAPPDGAASFDAVRAPSPGAPWLPCVLAGACAPGDRAEVALRRADVPVLSLHDLLVAPTPFLRPPPAGAVLGLTARPWAQEVTLGPAGDVQPWVVALAAALGSAAVHGAQVQPEPLPTFGWLLAWFSIAAFGLVLRGSRAWLLGAPAAAIGSTLALGAFGHVTYPLVTTALCAVAPAISRELSRVQVAMATLRRVALLVLRAATRAGMLRRALRTHPEVLTALADLTRNHLADRAIGWLARDGEGHRLRFIGGFGLERGGLRPEALDLRHPDLARLLDTADGGRADLLRDRATAAWAVPLRQAGDVVGLWLIAHPADQPGPDPRHLGRLAAWVSERLALEGHPGAFAGRAGLLPERAGDDTLERLFLGTETERVRWQRCVRAVGAPIVVADATGMVTDLNPAMIEALQLAGLPRVRSVRELLFRLDGEAALAEHIARLFAHGRPVELAWPGPGPRRTLVVAPVLPEVGEAEATYGFVAWLAEAGEADGRALEDRVRHWASSIGERLVSVIDAAEALAAADAASRRTHLVRYLHVELERLEADLRSVDGALATDNAEEEGPVDVVRLLRDEATRLAHLTVAADLTLAWRLPAGDPLVWASARTLQAGSRALLEAVVGLAVPGTELRLGAAMDGSELAVTLTFRCRADELIGAFLDGAPATRDVDACPAALRGLVLARTLLPDLEGATDPAGLTRLVLHLPEARGR